MIWKILFYSSFSGAENISSVEGDAKKTNLPDDIVIGDNGSTPKDIPDISTDDTTARQLRAVAEEEEDPALKEIYWDEYNLSNLVWNAGQFAYAPIVTSFGPRPALWTGICFETLLG